MGWSVDGDDGFDDAGIAGDDVVGWGGDDKFDDAGTTGDDVGWDGSDGFDATDGDSGVELGDTDGGGPNLALYSA